MPSDAIVQLAAGYGAFAVIGHLVQGLGWLQRRARIARECKDALAADAEAERERWASMEEEVAKLRAQLDRPALPAPQPGPESASSGAG